MVGGGPRQAAPGVEVRSAFGPEAQGGVRSGAEVRSPDSEHESPCRGGSKCLGRAAPSAATRT
eukprot:4966530-Pyramimonas_sp.AAC.1